jgi:hypothetical protein
VPVSLAMTPGADTFNVVLNGVGYESVLATGAAGRLTVRFTVPEAVWLAASVIV